MIASSIGGQRLKPLAKCRWFTLIGILDAVYPSGVPVDVHRASFDAVIRRFLLHTLPDGFHRIRHFGFMANGCRAAKLALCRSALLERIKCAETATDETAASQANVSSSACPECGGVMRIVTTLLRAADRGLPNGWPFRCDTS